MFRSIITDLDQFLISAIDKFTYRRLQRMFQSSFIYLNGRRITEHSSEKEARVGDTNWFPAKFVINPKDEYRTFPYQLYEGLTLDVLTPENNDVFNSATSVTSISGQFNKNITLGTGTVKVYQDEDLIYTFSNSDIVITDNIFTITFPVPLSDVGVYNVSIENGLFLSGVEVYPGLLPANWEFSILDGEYYEDDYEEDEYL